ncbi:uncharacterized protein LOC111046384 isoform X1 [Nilaparvata lugens]|uniref:uncharacterized protein LOC111046384 isoform X1 n=1 Tax=Nilaparvata lugens TaxID=108931 RepID=UPI000B9992AA|nr:uncharacterized protein LOC111046384 isoform X1 [Nilaparvata lugens]XP_039293937.1 uncharacterized protein LOC111046384 isoform X1 [Nilaparvata lugens]XP_039293938.1 uncharacterized protein LOC111046384 isoform X1 [Nilaparvata lugens]XP_039293939.1 uncharacterized protein LOC111046384 isoform X1 [Nilaparvata lugens]
MSCNTVEDGSWRICGQSLRTGTIIIGLLDIICAIYRGVNAAKWLVVEIDQIRKGGDTSGVFMSAVVVIILLLALLQFIASFILLWGVRNGLSSKIKLWVPAQKVLLVLYLILYIILFVLGYHWMDFLFLIFFHPVIIYFIPVVSSYARQN